MINVLVEYQQTLKMCDTWFCHDNPALRQGLQQSRISFVPVQVDIYVPNTFIANADGTNDLRRPFMIGIKELDYFRIFKSLGHLLFETNSPDTARDGRFKDISVDMQIVLWMLRGPGLIS